MKKMNLKETLENAKVRYATSGLPARIDPLLNRYRSLPAQQKKQAKMGAVLGLLVLHGFLFLTPTLGSFIDFTSKITRMSSDLAQAQADIDARESMEKVFSDADSQKTQLLEKMIQAGEAPKFLDTLAMLAKESRVQIDQLKPWRSKAGFDAKLFPLPKGFSTTGYEISVSAGYHELAQFVAKLENHSKVIHILEVKINHMHEDASKSHRGRIIFQMLEVDVL
jgi:Tfp pilus assembly protein PilO